MNGRKTETRAPAVKYPGIPAAIDGRTAIAEINRAACGIAGSSAAETAGLSLAGVRATASLDGTSLAAMHEALHAAAGRRLTCVLDVTCRPVPKQALSLHAGHDDYHAVDDAGFFQLFARNVQEVADLGLVARRIAELALTPGICAQDAVLTSETIESIRMAEPALVGEYLGHPADMIDSPTPAQRLVFGQQRRRVPELFDLDYPTMLGARQDADSYQQGIAGQRPFFLDHVRELADRAFDEYAALTGRRYGRCSSFRLEDAELVVVAQGSVVTTAEAVADHLRATRKLRVGVVNVTMFRPFPADLLTAWLRGRRGAVVLERVDQPLAVDGPLLREIRAAMSKAVENGRARGRGEPYPGLAACTADQVPDFYAGCFGIGGRDLRPADLVAAVDNMLEGGRRQRRFYLGIDFVRARTPLPKLQIWQEQLLEAYPQLASLALAPAAPVALRPANAVAVRIHALRGGDAAAVGRSLAVVGVKALGLHAKAGPAAGSAAFRATLAGETIPTGGEPALADVALALDVSAARHADAVAELAEGGALVVDSDRSDPELWDALPHTVRDAIKARKIRLFALDARGVARAEASDPSLAPVFHALVSVAGCLSVAPPAARQGLDDAKLVERARGGVAALIGSREAKTVDAALRAFQRGLASVRQVQTTESAAIGAEVGAVPERPAALDVAGAQPGLGNPGRFWEQVGYLYRTGQDGIADPFVAVGAVPAASSAVRDLTVLRTEVPELVPAKCTGCGQCWTHCPDSAIPGVVSRVEDVLNAALATTSGVSVDRVRQLVRHLAAEARRLIGEGTLTAFPDVLAQAYTAVVDKLGYDPARRAALDGEFAPVRAALADFPVARTAVFFDGPEAASPGTGGLLSVTVSPEACRGCNLCVDVCPEGALRAVPQTDAIVDRLRRNWKVWRALPETEDRYVDAATRDERVGPLPALLLKRSNYLSMLGGDAGGAGRGQKTILHLVLAAVNAMMQPRVREHVARLDDLIARLDQKARSILASDADLGRVQGRAGTVDIPLDTAKRKQVERVSAVLREVQDLRWRYVEGPGGRGRALCGVAAAAGSTAPLAERYPYNPFPIPWVGQLAPDAPALALGLFEAQMRKMARGVAAVRRAELELADEYDPSVHEAELSALDWRAFTDGEQALCPPLLVVSGDETMLDGGLQSLSELFASGKPVRVVVLDTRGAGTGPRNLALLAVAHRNVFVLQSSHATPSHLLAGLMKGLESRTPALFSLYCPPSGDGPAVRAPRAARLAVESRAFPVLVYDPSRGPRLRDRLSLEGNPALGAPWASSELRYVEADGTERSMELPLTAGDWAAGEPRFSAELSRIDGEEGGEPVPLHEYLELAADDRTEKRPFIYALGADGKLERLAVSAGIVRLAEERREAWAQLCEMAGLDVAAREAELKGQIDAVRAEYEKKIAEIKARYPRVIARRLAERLLAGGENGAPGVADLLARAEAGTEAPPRRADAPAAPAATAPAAAAAVATAPPSKAEKAEALSMEPYIDSALCTACNECTNLNKRMFAYNNKKQAFVKDAKAGTFKELVLAAEKCPVKIIHPGTPVNPSEKDLAKWIERARPFN